MAKALSSLVVKHTISADTIVENTPGHGVQVGGVTLQSNTLNSPAFHLTTSPQLGAVIQCDNATTGNAVWAAPVWSDANPLVKNQLDATKLVRIDASGLSSGTTRTVHVPNADSYVPDQETSTTSVPAFSGLRMTNNPVYGYVLKCDNAGTGNASWLPDAGSGVATAPFADTTAIVKDNLDDSKLLRFEVGAITTGTTRTVYAPDADSYLPNQEVGTTGTPSFVGLHMPTFAAESSVLTCSNGATGEAVWSPIPQSMQGVWYVAKNGNDSSGLGSVLKPFATISKALSMIAYPGVPTAEDEAKTYVIRVAPGVYPEELVKEVRGLHITLEALGGGTVYIPNPLSLTSLVRLNSNQLEFGNRATVKFTGKWVILGTVDLGGVCDCEFEGCDLEIVSLGLSGTLTLKRCVVGAVLQNVYWGSEFVGLNASDCVFKHLIEVGNYGWLRNCTLNTTMTWLDSPAVGGGGLVGCVLGAGMAFGANAENQTLLMDGATLQSFQVGNCTLVGTGVTLFVIDTPNTMARKVMTVASTPFVIPPNALAEGVEANPTTEDFHITLPPITTTRRRLLTVRNQSLTHNLVLSTTDRIWNSTLTTLTIPPDTFASFETSADGIWLCC